MILNPFPIFSTSGVGTPGIIFGELFIEVPSVSITGGVGTPALASINMQGAGIPSNARVGYCSIFETTTKNKIWPIVEYSLPQFIQNDHRNFIEFIKEYYRFNESVTGPWANSRCLLEIQDIDTTKPEFVDNFFREFGPTFPKNILAEPSVVIKLLKEFYKVKGTEDSYRFLFRVLFGQEITFYYPRKDIFRASDAKWSQDVSVRGTLIAGDPSSLIGNRIIGEQTKAAAFVEKITLIQEGPISLYELFLNRSSISGIFSPDEIIRSEDQKIKLRVLNSIVGATIDNGGAGYQVGQNVTILGGGFNAQARIRAVDALSGEIKRIEVIRPGAGYTPSTTTIDIPLYPGVFEKATARPVFSTIIRYPGYFLNQDSFLNSNKFLHDSVFYQQFSYEIESEESPNRYESIVRSLLHPAGLELFFRVLTETEINAEVSVAFTDDYDCSIVELDYEHTWGEPPEADRFMDFSPEVCTEIEVDYNTVYSENNYPLGPTWKDWEFYKWDQRPYFRDQGKVEFGNGNPGNVGLGADTPLKVYSGVPLKEIKEKPWTSIDIIPDTVITSSATGGVESTSTVGVVVVQVL